MNEENEGVAEGHGHCRSICTHCSRAWKVLVLATLAGVLPAHEKAYIVCFSNILFVHTRYS